MSDDPASSATARQLAEGHYYAALDLVLEGHHEQAVEEYRKAVADDPKFTDALHGLSRALQDLNRLDEAIVLPNESRKSIPTTFWRTPASRSCIRKKEWSPKPRRKGTRLGCWDGSSS